MAARRYSAYTDPMKFWSRFVACFLIAWLPLLGFTAQARTCPEMVSSSMSRPADVSSRTVIADSNQKETGHTMSAASVCHDPGGLSCGVALPPAAPAAVDVPSSPVFRATIPLLIGQFVSEPLQPPPRTL